MTVKVATIGLMGLEGYVIHVEVQAHNAVPSIVIVGLPDAAINESKERLKSALHHLDYNISTYKIVMHLLPPDRRKRGSLFDLAMAIGILRELHVIHQQIPDHTAFIGALALDGSILRSDDLLPTVLAAKSLGIKTLYVPNDPSIPLDLIEGIQLIVVSHLREVVNHLNGKIVLHAPKRGISTHTKTYNQPLWQKDFSYIVGQKEAIRGLEIAAAGEHNVLMSGPPGSGKSLLAETFPTILPPISLSAQLEVMSLYQLAGSEQNLQINPPFRNPHHSSSSISLVGGGSNPKPGEISLAHRGVLFLDEMAEFPKRTLDMLRQPLETGKITISRVHSTVSYPASFILVGATNPCPCGYLQSNQHYCTCTPRQVQHYRHRISGPITDRIDVLLNLQSTSLYSLQIKNESSKSIQIRTTQARQRQYTRYGEEISNGRVPFEKLIVTSPLTASQTQMIQHFSAERSLSSRTQAKIIRIARTISDLEGKEHITDEAIWEAIQLRRLEFHKKSLLAKEKKIWDAK